MAQSASEVPSITAAPFQPIRCTSRDIKKLLVTLGIAKTMGPDDIAAMGLMTCAPEQAELLTKLFQYSYNTGNYLTMWKIAPLLVHKKQDKSNLASYVPITLLSIISKVMEGVIHSAIKQHLLNNNLLTDT
eukprot:g20805.t1